MWAFCLGTILFISTLIWAQNRKKESPKIHGIYSQPGKWYYLKYIVFLLLMKTRRLLNKRGKGGGLGEGLGAIEKWDKPQQLSSDDKAFDAVFLHGAAMDGYYLAMGVERRHGGKANALFYLVTPDLGLLMNPQLPNTSLDVHPVAIYNMQFYSAEGISFTPIKPMKLWKISYEGPLRLQNDPTKLVDVKFDVEFTSDFPHFVFDTDMDVRVLSRAFAREKWNRQFFENLKRAHQTHYEQMGQLNGSLVINGDKREILMEGFRDHSFGMRRDWTIMHRYIYHVLHLKDGTRISVGVVSQPCTSSHLEMGYVLLPNGVIYPIVDCDLKLYQHGENGKLPQNLAFSITTKLQSYRIKVEVEIDEVHYKSEAKMVERFVKCWVNGVEGRGVSEWNYNRNEYP